MKTTPSETPILNEVIPPYILGTRLSSRNQAIGLVWGSRFAGMILACLLAVALHIGSTSAIAVVVSIFGIFLIFLYSEVVGTKYVKSATPIMLFSNGIQVPILYYDRLHGLRRFIRYVDIAFVEIDRRDVYQMMVFRNGRGIKWHDAPVSMKIHLRNGKKYSSGIKVPGQVLAIAQMLNDKFGIDVKDRGNGRGGMTIYEGGKPVE